MALQSTFFGKREAEPLNNRTTPGTSSMALPSGSASPSTSSSQGSSPSGASGLASPFGAASPQVSKEAAPESPSKLTVGPNIKLKGVEITDCDTLVVEGLVEATMDSRVIQISEQGAFKGSAEIDIAEIHGVFEGNLVARQKLVIYATGRVTGKVRYGKIVIEEGGQLGGEIQYGVGTSSGSSSAGASAASGSSSSSSASHSGNKGGYSNSNGSRERDGAIAAAA